MKLLLSVGDNSYVTVSDADAYFASRLDVFAWTNASPEQKAQALSTASMMLNGETWIGHTTLDTQTLAFPREGASYHDPMLGRTVTLDGSIVPSRILQATFEQAYHLLNNDGLLDDMGSIKNLEVGSIKLEHVVRSPAFSNVASTIYKPLLERTGASRAWFRAN